MNGLACPPCRIDLLADDAVFVLGRVEDNGLKLAEVNVTLFVEDALVSTHVDNLANHTGTTVLVFIEGHDLTLQRQLVLVDNRCIDIGTWRDGESCLGHLIGYAEVVALGNVALRGEADGEGLL